jgi:hypothetical protein
MQGQPGWQSGIRGSRIRTQDKKLVHLTDHQVASSPNVLGKKEAQQAAISPACRHAPCLSVRLSQSQGLQLLAGCCSSSDVCCVHEAVCCVLWTGRSEGIDAAPVLDAGEATGSWPGLSPAAPAAQRQRLQHHHQ